MSERSTDAAAFARRLAHGPALILGEIAQAHDGSLGFAHAMIDAIAKTGADAIKFQTHIADAESTPGEPWRVRFSPQDETRYDYWKRMEFTAEQWAGLKKHADECGLFFLSSAFSFEALDLLEALEIPAWKIASGEVSNHPMLKAMAATGRPILLSSGMSSWSELDDAVSRIHQVQGEGGSLAVFQCTSAYPCPPERIGLEVLDEIRSRYGCPAGLSDHSGSRWPSLAAVTLGAAAVEVHVALSREMFGPDVVASITTAELADLVEGVRYTEAMRSGSVDKDAEAKAMEPMRLLFTKSLVANVDLDAGTALEKHHIALKKPGTGLPPADLHRVVGRRLKRSLARNEAILAEDLEEGLGPLEETRPK